MATLSTQAKSVFSGPVLTVWAGIEGVGHHGVCATIAPHCPACAAATCELTKPCFRHDVQLERIVRVLSPARPATFQLHGQALLSRLRSYSASPHAQLLRIHFQCTSGESGTGFKASFPDLMLAKGGLGSLAAPFEGVLTTHLDLLQLAELSERAGVDLRVVHLRRDPLSAIRSRLRTGLTSHAPLETVARYMRDSDAILHAGLRALDRQFVLSVDYERLTAQIDELAAFLRVEGSGFEQNLRAKWRTTAPNNRTLVAQQLAARATRANVSAAQVEAWVDGLWHRVVSPHQHKGLGKH